MKLFGVPYRPNHVLLLVGDVAVAFLAIFLGHIFRFGLDDPLADPFRVLQHYTGASLVFIGSMLLALYLADAYNTRLDFRKRFEVLRLGISVVLGVVAQLLITGLIPHAWWGRGVAATTFLTMGLLLPSWRALFSAIRPQPTFRRSVLIVGAGNTGHDVMALLAKHESAYEVLGFVGDDRIRNRRHDDRAAPIPETSADLAPPLGTVGDLPELIVDLDVDMIVVALSGSFSVEMTAALLDAKSQGVHIEDAASLTKRLSGKVPIQFIRDQSLIFGAGFTGRSRFENSVLRIADVVIAAIGAALTLPIVLFFAALVRLESPGPAFFLQERLGKDEKPFRIIKLRTMRNDAEKDGPQWSKGAGDPRVTRLGKFLRRSRIDELPQFWNVLRGDMSMVGPRPERKFFVDRLKQQIPFYALRFAVQPGVSGWAQVKYRYGATDDDAAEKLCYELYAIQEMSPVLYLVILLKTVQTVLLRPGS